MGVVNYLWRLVSAFLLAAVLGACGSSDRSAELPSWGSEATRFFEGLSLAYTENDFYGVLDFYDSSAFVEKWRGDLEGGASVPDLLRWNSGDLGQEILAVHLGSNGALTLVRWSSTAELGAIESLVDQDLITRETVFDHGYTLGRSLRASPGVVSQYEALYAAYAEAWSRGNGDDLTLLYAPDATVQDPLLGIEATGRDAIRASGAPGRAVDVTAAGEAGGDVSDRAPAVYLGPSEYGQDPRRAIGVYQVTDDRGCIRQVAVRWLFEDGLIVDEQRYQEVESFRRCAPDDPPAGWWTGLALPRPRDQVVTGVLRTPGGKDVIVHNGTPRLEELLQDGIKRFAEADMAEPRLDSVTFEPSRKCDGLSGRVLESGGSRDLFLCIYESEVCHGGESCTRAALSVRVAVLHELGHAWLLDHVGIETQTRLLDSTGRETWNGTEVSWARRGVEYAAEIVAWGLLEDANTMVRIGNPGCEELFASFRLLTGADPLRDESDCIGT